MIRTLTTLIERLLRPSRGNRRGTVLLMALGVLGILSIAAISYVTIVRLDRASAEAGSRRASFQQQPDAVVAHIGALLTADLFGNKIVSSGDPVQFWPRMFEDGDTRDYPFTDINTFNTNDIGEPASPNSILTAIENIEEISILQGRQVAYPDDAWLASTEPDWTHASETSPWPNITNLRSAYSLNTRTSPRQWERDHGRFVDLGEWFLQANELSAAQFFPNPGVSLMSVPVALGPLMGVNQDVFQHQTNVMARYIDPPETAAIGAGEIDPLTPRDERQLVDTDGDLRPDARWQQLDSLGNLFGLNWVVAARIIDASALINVNTALEFGPSGDPDRQADGRTPADVDLYRLIFGAGPTSIFEEPVENIRVDAAFREWINNDLNIRGIIDDVRSLSAPGTGYFSALDPNFVEWTPGNGITSRLQRLEREAFYHSFGSSPQSPATSRGTAVPIRDLIDLAGFASTNNLNILSYTEQRFDGPEVGGYLPDGSPVGNFGPMRSRELPEDIRAFAQFPESAANQRPSNDQIRLSPRRFLTTVSGDAPFSPVPVLNTSQNSAYRGANLNTKIPLDRPLTDETTRAAFESFVWALAPLATNLPLDRALRDANAFNVDGAEFHYGGGLDGPALIGNFARFSPQTTTAVVPNDASYAIITAASLAANLRDALDGDGTAESRAPTVIRLFASDPLSSQQLTVKSMAQPVRATILGTAFSHGVVEPANVSLLGPGQDQSMDPAGPGGMTIVGLERQPFLTEFLTVAVYTDASDDSSGVYLGGNQDGVVGDEIQDELGSAILFELANPWSTPITLSEYSVVIPDDASANSFGPDSLTLNIGGGSLTIEPGARHAFFWILEDDFGAWGEVRREILARWAGYQATALSDASISPPPSVADRRVAFRDVANGSRPVLLVHRRQGGATGFPGFVVDRMAPDLGDVFPVAFTGSNEFNFASSTVDTLEDAPFRWDNWYAQLGYTDPFDPRWLTEQVTGRVMVTSTLQRSRVQPAGGGFPGYVLEVPNANHVHTRTDGHAWLYPIQPGGPNPDPVGSIPNLLPITIITGYANLGQYSFPLNHADVRLLDKRADDGSQNPGILISSEIPPFQLYVPLTGTADAGPTGVRLNALSELHMLSSYAHTCRTRDPMSPRPWVDELKDLTNWQTVGEKLGLSLRRDFRQIEMWDPAMSQYPAGDINPYLGTLDPTRFTLNDGQMGNVFGLPDTMAIPLALRVFDCFWPASLNSELGQGRININTAPEEVLRCLPLVDPEFAVGGGGGPLPPVGQVGGRLETMIRYRDPDPMEREGLKSDLNLTAWRLRKKSGVHEPRGFISTGELAILDQWEPGGTGQLAPNAVRWAQMADPAVIAVGSPLEMVTEYVDPSFNPLNDPEERLALYRAVSNIVSTRSDVFIAWFIVRGYQPAAMERIPINGSSDEVKLAAMDSDVEPFRPAYESRWLVVFDRSNVRRPTDRPRVLLQVELPRATP